MILVLIACGGKPESAAPEAAPVNDPDPLRFTELVNQGMFEVWKKIKINGHTCGCYRPTGRQIPLPLTKAFNWKKEALMYKQMYFQLLKNISEVEIWVLYYM